MDPTAQTPAVEAADEHLIVVPGHALILLIGASGSGKSSFARRHFRSTEILSSDAFRAMVADDESDQRATPAAFDLLGRAAVHRLTRARLTVIDATNVKAADRRGLLELARRLNRPAVGIVLALPDEVVATWNRLRPGRVVDGEVVARHNAAVRDLAADPGRLLGEGFAAVHVLRGPREVDAVRFVRSGRPPRVSPPAAPRAGRPARTA